MTYGILVPQPGIKPMSPALQGEFLTTEPPGKSPACCFLSHPASDLSLRACYSLCLKCSLCHYFHSSLPFLRSVFIQTSPCPCILPSSLCWKLHPSSRILLSLPGHPFPCHGFLPSIYHLLAHHKIFICCVFLLHTASSVRTEHFACFVLRCIPNS